MFGFDFEDQAEGNQQSFGVRSAYRGTVALQTLRRPKVKTLRQVYNTAVDDEKLRLAQDAGLDELLALYQHEHPKVKGLASTALSHLTVNSEDEAVIASKEGYKALLDLLEIKDEDVRVKAANTLSIVAEQSDTQEMLLEASGGWDKIIALVTSRNSQIQQAGLLLCGSLVVNDELRESFIKEGCVQAVLKVSGNKDVKVQRALATCLANVAQEAEAVKDILGGDGLKRILQWVNQGDTKLTGSSISILANASNNEAFKEPLLQNRVLNVVPPLLKSDDDTTRTGSLILCANLSTVEEATNVIANTCLDNLLELAKSTDVTDQLYRAVVCFSNLASYDESRNAIRAKGVDTFLKELHATSKDLDTKKEVTQALAELGEYVKVAIDDEAEEEEKEDEEDKSAKDELKEQLKALIDQLDSASSAADSEKATAEILHIISRKETHGVLWTLGGFGSLVQHITAGEPEAAATASQVNAIKALTELARHKKNRVRIGNSQAIPPLLRHLKNCLGNHQLAEAILFILLDLTLKDTLIENFRLAKPLDPLMAHLMAEVPHEEVQTGCLDLMLRAIKGHVPSQVAFRVLQGYDLVSRLLASPSIKVKEGAALVLGTACVGQRRMQQAAAKAKAIKLLSALLVPKEDLRVRLAACMSLGQIIQQNQTNQEKLRKEAGAVEAIIDLLAVSGSTPDYKNPEGPTVEQQTQWAALYALGNFVYLYSKAQNLVRTKKGITPVMEFVKSTDKAVTIGIKEQAARMLCYVCFYNSKNQDLICTPAMASAIVDCLGSDSRRLQYYVEGLIWSLAHSNKKRRAILVDAGAIGALLELIKSPCEPVAKGAEWAKQALSKK